jgi:hypothetical protein
MRLVSSPALSEEDIVAIQRGLDARMDIVTRALLRAVVEAASSPAQRRVALLSWLIADQRLDLRIAVAKPPALGVFHEKIAIFSDPSGDRVAISGSANETRGGLIENFETVDVFMSWESSASRVLRKARHFESLWDDDTPGLDVLPFPDAVRSELLKRIPPDPASAGEVPEPGPMSRRRFR